MTSNVRYDENLCVMASHVRNSERGAVLYDCIVLNNGVVTTYTKKDPARTIYAFLALQFSPQMLVYFSCTLYMAFYHQADCFYVLHSRYTLI